LGSGVETGIGSGMCFKDALDGCSVCLQSDPEPLCKYSTTEYLSRVFCVWKKQSGA